MKLKLCAVIYAALMLVSCGAKPIETSSVAVQNTVSIPTFESNIEVVKEYEPNIVFGKGEFGYEKFYDSYSGKEMLYRLHIPENFDSQKKYSVLLFLHGMGEIGNDNKLQLKFFIKSFDVMSDILEEAIIICPQTPANWALNEAPGDKKGYLGVTKRIVDDVISKHNGDSERVYLTGISLGSFATWDMLEGYPNYFAAAVPVCGGNGSSICQSFIDTPIWIFHGTDDKTVSYSGSLSTYNAIKSAGGKKIKMTTLEGVDHNAWDYAYVDREMFSWMFSQKLGRNHTDYQYINVFEVVSEKGSIMFTERDITGASYFVRRGSHYIELTLEKGVSNLLIDKFQNNPDEIFSVEFYREKLYDFKFKSSPEENKFRIEKTLDDTTFEKMHQILER